MTSLLEPSSDQKNAKVEESLAYQVSITNAVSVDNHMEYVIAIDQGSTTWTVQKRYSDFRTLHQTLVSNSGLDIEFPAKKMTGNKEREFIATRQLSLQNFITFITSHPNLKHSLMLKMFLNPVAYSADIADILSQNVSMALRAYSNYEVTKTLPEIGWRASKQFFQVKDINDPKVEKILSWSQPGPDFHFDQRTLTSLQRSLSQLQHPSIFTTDLLILQPHGCLSIRPLINQGSLRDWINDTKPRLNYLKKSLKTSKSRNFDLNTIRSVGFQILSVLKFLHDKNAAHGNLHAGNIFIGSDGSPIISETENYFNGSTSILRPFIVQLKGPCSSAEALDVYCFGHFLFEMATGSPLQNPTCDNALPSQMPEQLKSLLENLLSLEATRMSNYPSLEELLENQFFSNAIGSISKDSNGRKQYLKFSASTKESLAKHKSDFESRLLEDHKKFKTQEKERRRQEILSDDSRKKKRQTKIQANVLDEAISIPNSNNESMETNGKSSQVTNPAPPAPPMAPPMAPPAPPMAPPIAPPAPPKGPPAPPVAPTAAPSGGAPRTALLGSISSFQKGGLKKTVTVDKSKPKI